MDDDSDGGGEEMVSSGDYRGDGDCLSGEGGDYGRGGYGLWRWWFL